MEDQQRQTDAGQAGVQSLQAPGVTSNHSHHHTDYHLPEERHAQPQLDPAGPAQLVRAQPRLDLGVGGDLWGGVVILSGQVMTHLLHSDPPHLHLGQQRADQAAQ